MTIRVYIVEDSEIIRKRIFRLLSAIEFVEICGSCDELKLAVKEIELTKPDAVILDISVKEGNGIKMIKEIKSKVPGTSVVMFTNFDIKNYKEMAFHEGADYFLDKSNEFTQLTDILNTVRKERTGEFMLGTL
jgi:DNA-binding NarL/FixJ family response regulator